MGETVRFEADLICFLQYEKQQSEINAEADKKLQAENERMNSILEAVQNQLRG